MLCEFRVRNFLSFDDEQVFSMEAGRVRNNKDRLYTEDGFKLVKFKAIYGANASGKSNLIDAMGFAQAVVLHGIPKGSENCYCRISDDNKNKLSCFEFTIKIGETKYVYGFEMLINSKHIVSEYLRQHKYGTTWKDIFNRNTEDGQCFIMPMPKYPDIYSNANVYIKGISREKGILFLTEMNKYKSALYEVDSPIQILKKLYDWFRYDLRLADPDMPIEGYSYLLDSENVHQIEKMLSDFGTGISKVTLAEISKEKVISKLSEVFFNDIVTKLEDRKNFYEEKNIDKTPAVILGSKQDNVLFIIELGDKGIQCKTIEFKHHNTDATFSLNEESDGTNRLLDLIEVLLSKDDCKVYVIDELNRTFHPLMTYKFVEDFLELAKERNIQLIVTTHESIIMDLDLLRQDEIDFLDKDEMGRSTISSLASYKARFDKKVINCYLEGDYNGIPRIQTGRSKKYPKTN